MGFDPKQRRYGYLHIGLHLEPFFLSGRRCIGRERCSDTRATIADVQSCDAQFIGRREIR